jgi:uncharacterized repeat protein (TIGR01451 family)
MKVKLLLAVLVLFSITSVFAQIPIYQPSNLVSCDTNNDGWEGFMLLNKNAEILGNLSPDIYIVSYHETQVNAVNNQNQLFSPYACALSPKTLFVRVTEISNTNNYGLTTLTLVINPNPIAQVLTLTQCSDVTTSFPCWDLQSMVPQIVQNNPNLQVQFYQTQADAFSSTNVIANPTCYISASAAPNTPPVFYRVFDLQTGCFSVSMIELVIINCTPCDPPILFVENTTQNSITVLNTSIPQGTTQTWELSFQPVGGPPPSQGYMVSTFSEIITNLACSTTYEVYARSYCNTPIGIQQSQWSSPLIVTTVSCGPQYGTPQSYSGCVDTGNQFCITFDDNNLNLMGTVDPTGHTITYHLSNDDAINGINLLSSPYCVGEGNHQVYAKVLKPDTSYFTSVFYINVRTFNTSQTQLQGLSQCDENNDGFVSYDLTSAQAQINTSNSLIYYTSSANAEANINPITNPSAYLLSTTIIQTGVFIREIVDNDCDLIYTLTLTSFGNCNLASACNQANSLCSAIGIPFTNTVNVPSAGQYGCLGSTPNPTWFYLPVVTSGTINLRIEQNSLITFNGAQHDVDYAVFGPFDDPVTPCANQLTPNFIVSCSFSAASVEFPVINNAIAGKYYLIMVTNFSNQSGFIKIDNLGNSQGAIDCTGLRLNAFLDTNTNGVQDNGEQNFPLGQFQYEVNSNGIIHNITAPTGVYSIYDINTSNSYDLSYSVNASYAALYNVTIPSYSNVQTVSGAGMLQYNFPVTIVQPYNDLSVVIIPINAPRPGFVYKNKLVYSNLGNQMVTSGTVTFTKDPNLSIVTISQAGTTAITNGFSYNFLNLAPFESRVIDIDMQVPVIPTVNAGQLLTNNATIVPLTGDIVTENNAFSLTEMVINAYDPNDKMESHGERILHSSFSSNDYLYYTIRFENTGNASAINVRVNDVLDSQLDENSLQMIRASHPYVLDRVGNVLNWKFDNIQLPVSVPNTTTGKGYITFKIKPRPGYAVGDIIPNTAAIYFDFNPAIITNTFNTEFVALLSNSVFDNQEVIIYPNPTNSFVNVNANSSISTITIYDMLGKKVIVKLDVNSNTETIDLTQLNKGIYLIEIVDENDNKATKKLVIK